MPEINERCPRRRTVLLLDDFPDAGEAMCEWFKLEGWDAVSVATVEAARRRMTVEMPTVLIVEPWLRSGSAMSLAAEVRANRSAQTVLISISASSRSGGDVAYEPTLFDFNFSKPMDCDRLREVLRTLTESS